MAKLKYTSTDGQEFNIEEYWEGFKYYENFSDLHFINTKERHFLYLIYISGIVTIADLCFMTNYDHHIVSCHLRNLSQESNRQRLLNKKEMKILGRNSSVYYLSKYGYEEVNSFINDNIEDYFFFKGNSNTLYHDANARYLFFRCFKNAYDIHFEREVDIYGYDETKTKKRADIVLSVHYNKETMNKFIIEHESISKSNKEAMDTMQNYVESFNRTKDNILVITTLNSTYITRNNVNNYRNTGNYKKLIELQDSLEDLRKALARLKSNNAKYKDCIRNLFYQNELVNVFSTFKKYIKKKNIIADEDTKELIVFPLIESEMLKLLKSEELLFNIVPHNITFTDVIRLVDACKFNYLENKAIHEVEVMDLLSINKFKELILNLPDYNYISNNEKSKLKEYVQEYYEKVNISDVSDDLDGVIIEKNDNTIYKHNSFKTSMLTNEIIIGNKYTVGDVISSMSSSMENTEELFKTLFFQSENISDFKYEPVSFNKGDVVCRKSLYSATCTLNGRKIGMIIMIPSISFSDEYKISKINSIDGPIIPHNLDDILSVTIEPKNLLKLEDVIDVFEPDSDEYERNYFKYFVHNKFGHEEDELSWIDDELRNKVKSLTNSNLY